MRPKPVTRWTFAGLLLLFAAGPAVSPSVASPPRNPQELLEQVQIVDKGSSSRSTRRDAASELPLNGLPGNTRRAVNELVKSVDLFRRLPTLRFEVDPRVYQYFTTNPDVAVSIWRALNVSSLKMQQTPRGDYAIDGGDGTAGSLGVLYRDGNQQLIICDGEFESPILKKTIKARALMHLVTTAERFRDGRMFVTHRLDLFVTFPSQTVSAAAKLTSPVSNVIIDRNFREVSLFVRMMSLAMARQPDWVENLAEKLEGIVEQRKAELIRLTAQVFLANQERMQSSREEVNSPTEDAAAQNAPVPVVPRFAMNEVEGGSSP